MAQIPLTIPNAQVSRVVNALCIAGGYSGDVDDNAARNAFAVAHLAKYVRDTVQRIEHGQATRRHVRLGTRTTPAARRDVRETGAGCTTPTPSPKRFGCNRALGLLGKLSRLPLMH